MKETKTKQNEVRYFSASNAVGLFRAAKAKVLSSCLSRAACWELLVCYISVFPYIGFGLTYPSTALKTCSLMIFLFA